MSACPHPNKCKAWSCAKCAPTQSQTTPRSDAEAYRDGLLRGAEIVDEQAFVDTEEGGGEVWCLHSAAEAIRAEAASPVPPRQDAREDGRKDDPSADDRWVAGCDFAMTQFCAVLDVDPATVNWDAATETLDGDVQAVIWNIFRERFGDEWPLPPAPQESKP